MLGLSIRITATIALLAGITEAAGPPTGPLTRCPPDAVVSGPSCIDKFEASVWRVPEPTTTNRRLVRRIQTGTVTLVELWMPRSTTCGTWNPGVSPTDDDQCLAGVATDGEPGALLRGGDFGYSTSAPPPAHSRSSAS